MIVRILDCDRPKTYILQIGIMNAGANLLVNVQVCESSRMHIMSFYNFLVVSFLELLGLPMLFKMVFKQTKPYYHIYLLLLCYVKL